MNNIKKALPSFFTSLGLISGCISVMISLSRGDLTLAGYFIIAAAIFDFIDGMAARLVNNISAFGKQLDSLADVVSFGVAPSMILYRLMLLSYVGGSHGTDFDVMNPGIGQSFILYTAFLVAVFSALRLAKFNIDPDQVKNFKGLPTPANALFFAALGFIVESSHYFPATDIIFNPYFLLVTVILSCYLLVSNNNMFSFKFSSFGIRQNLMRYLLLVFAVLLIVIYGFSGFAPIIVLYVILSLINNWFVKME
jgi:CDP-diacylglycerol--serine O-phosphatidyltransferase